MYIQYTLSIFHFFFSFRIDIEMPCEVNLKQYILCPFFSKLIRLSSLIFFRYSAFTSSCSVSERLSNISSALALFSRCLLIVASSSFFFFFPHLPFSSTFRAPSLGQSPTRRRYCWSRHGTGSPLGWSVSSQPPAWLSCTRWLRATGRRSISFSTCRPLPRLCRWP